MTELLSDRYKGETNQRCSKVNEFLAELDHAECRTRERFDRDKSSIVRLQSNVFQREKSAWVDLCVSLDAFSSLAGVLGDSLAVTPDQRREERDNILFALLVGVDLINWHSSSPDDDTPWSGDYA